MIELHHARDQDKSLVWIWGNDSETRRQSFNQEPISWAEHCLWWENHKQFVQIGWTPVGVVRVEPNMNDNEISINVAPSLRGRGFGTEMIRAASRDWMRAEIKETNEASLRAFTAAGYVELDHTGGVVTMTWEQT